MISAVRAKYVFFLTLSDDEITENNDNTKN